MRETFRDLHPCARLQFASAREGSTRNRTIRKANLLSSTDTSTETTLDTQNSADATSTTHAGAHDHAHEHDHNHDHAHGDHAGHTHAAPAMNPECTRTVEVPVPAEDVSAEFASVLKRYRKQARIPGFRAGKVPEAVIRTKFADSLRQDVLESILPKHLRQAIDAQGLQPVSQPQVTDLHLAEKEPLRFKAAFEVLSPIDITGYNDVKVDVPDATVTDEEYQSELDRIRNSQAVMEPITEDRPLADGDFAVIRFTGKVHSENDQPTRPIAGEDPAVEIGSPNTVEAFTIARRGAKVGQQMQFDASYPEEFSEPRLAGKTVSYDIEVKAIQKKNLPEMDDAFASTQAGEETTIAAFQEKLRERLTHEKRRHLEGAAKDKLLAALVERFPFAVPESLLQQQVDARLDRGLRALAAQGMTTEQMRKLDFERLRGAQRDGAMIEVKGLLILDRIAESENIQVSEEEVADQLQLLSYQMREPVESLTQRLTQEGGLARIREQMRREKTVTQLYSRMAG